MKVLIGWDPREQRAYDVAHNSIVRRASMGLESVNPLRLQDIRQFFTRPIEVRDGRLWCPISEAPMATEFAISRFSIPWIIGTGMVLFVDADVVALEDVVNMEQECKDPSKAVWVVKHANLPQEGVKMDNQLQLAYARKNWSSVMLWNMDHPAHVRLTLDKLNGLPGRSLHAFSWLKDEEIGELDQRWNQLVGVHNNAHPGRGGILHYTLGGPWFADWKGGQLDDVWTREEQEQAEYCHE